MILMASHYLVVDVIGFHYFNDAYRISISAFTWQSCLIWMRDFVPHHESKTFLEYLFVFFGIFWWLIDC